VRRKFIKHVDRVIYLEPCTRCKSFTRRTSFHRVFLPICIYVVRSASPPPKQSWNAPKFFASPLPPVRLKIHEQPAMWAARGPARQLSVGLSKLSIVRLSARRGDGSGPCEDNSEIWLLWRFAIAL
jgi:hypothetical protein